MKTIKSFLLLIMVLVTIASFSQSKDQESYLSKKIEGFTTSKKIDYKFFNGSIDINNLRLKEVNDTLRYFYRQKKEEIHTCLGYHKS